MHPILATRRRIFFYLQAWLPILALLVNVSHAAGAGVLDSLAVFAPAVAVFAFVCLSPYPICRARPLRPPAVPGILVTFLVAGSMGSLRLVGTAARASAAIARPAVLAGSVTGMVFVIG